MKHKSFLGILGCCLLAGCSSPVELTTTFNPQEVAWFDGPGGNTLDGSAVMRTVGGDAKTCAALPVELVPVSRYAEERMLYLYGNADHGFDPVFLGKSANFKNEDPNYLKHTKRTQCDAQGNFEFSALPDGSYFIVSNVIWGTGSALGMTEGGAIMQRVNLQGGEKKRIILTQ